MLRARCEDWEELGQRFYLILHRVAGAQSQEGQGDSGASGNEGMREPGARENSVGGD